MLRLLYSLHLVFYRALYHIGYSHQSNLICFVCISKINSFSITTSPLSSSHVCSKQFWNVFCNTMHAWLTMYISHIVCRPGYIHGVCASKYLRQAHCHYLIMRSKFIRYTCKSCKISTDCSFYFSLVALFVRFLRCFFVLFWWAWFSQTVNAVHTALPLLRQGRKELFLLFALKICVRLCSMFYLVVNSYNSSLTHCLYGLLPLLHPTSMLHSSEWARERERKRGKK